MDSYPKSIQYFFKGHSLITKGKVDYNIKWRGENFEKERGRGEKIPLNQNRGGSMMRGTK